MPLDRSADGIPQNLTQRMVPVRCEWEDCGAVLQSVDTLKDHIEAVHRDKKNHEVRPPTPSKEHALSCRYRADTPVAGISAHAKAFRPQIICSATLTAVILTCSDGAPSKVVCVASPSFPQLIALQRLWRTPRLGTGVCCTCCPCASQQSATSSILPEISSQGSVSASPAIA
jgi:hypothetical protein